MACNYVLTVSFFFVFRFPKLTVGPVFKSDFFSVYSVTLSRETIVCCLFGRGLTALANFKVK